MAIQLFAINFAFRPPRTPVARSASSCELNTSNVSE